MKEEVYVNGMIDSFNCQPLQPYWVEYSLTMKKGGSVYSKHWKTQHESWDDEALPTKLTREERQAYWKDDEESINFWMLTL